MTDLQERLARGLAGRYTLERELGQGGMAIVFLARDLRHDRSVAVKVLRPEISADVGAERFLREIKLAAGLTHAHILPVHDSGAADGLLFYVMPTMEGRSLRERIDQERQLSLDEAIRIACEVASALDYAHRHGVVHRDVKPENILLHEGAAMVADFGIGRALTAERSITQTGLAIGTPTYMSPEQATGERTVDGRSDLYSLACVLYEMLAGEPPFTGSTIQAVLTKRLVGAVPKIGDVREVPPGVERALTRALARTPADRFATAAEFADALRSDEPKLATGRRTPVELAKGASVQKAIAVLPLANRSADPENEYFSDGMTEEIINALSKLPDLQVASRSSCFAFKGKEVDIKQVGGKLGVGSVLEGSVRKVGNRIRIAIQLVSVDNGYQLWSETYDRQLEDVFAIQDEISRAIVDALKLKLGTGASPAVAPTRNLDAYNVYLKARFFYNKFNESALRKSLDFYEQALVEDAGFARAHAGIADVWCTLADDWTAPEEAYPKAKVAALRALELDADLAEAKTPLGKVLGWFEWQFAAAERQLREAVALSPSYAEAHWAFGSILPTVGRLGEAIEEMRKAITLDPLVHRSSRWLARFFLYAGEWDFAIAQSHKTLELKEDNSVSYLDIGTAYLAKGEAEQALDWYQRGQRFETSVRSYDAYIARALAALGRREEAEAILTRLQEESTRHYVRAEILAMGHASLGNFDVAFECLERAYRDRSGGLIYFHVDPGYRALRSDPRFDALVRRIGLK